MSVVNEIRQSGSCRRRTPHTSKHWHVDTQGIARSCCAGEGGTEEGADRRKSRKGKKMPKQEGVASDVPEAIERYAPCPVSWGCSHQTIPLCRETVKTLRRCSNWPGPVPSEGQGRQWASAAGVGSQRPSAGSGVTSVVSVLWKREGDPGGGKAMRQKVALRGLEAVTSPLPQ